MKKQKDKVSIVRYIFFMPIIILIIFSGIKIYKDSNTYGTKTYRIVHKIKSEREIKFEKNNIYEYGVKGIFDDINKKCKLPSKMYMSNDLNIKFNKDGKITYFETLIYGKDKEGEDKSYLIYFDKNKSNSIKVIMDEAVNVSYSNDKIIDPLFETVECISIKDTVKNWNQKEFGLLYKGKRNWEGNREGIVLINENGKEVPNDLIQDKLVGYTVSIYIPDREDITPVRYNLLADSYWFGFLNTEEEDKLSESKEELEFITGKANSNDEFYLQDGIRYRLNVEDKATGSFFYSLQQTTDGGNKWVVLNEDPFDGPVGEACGMYFMDENIGFIVVSKQGGNESDVYMSEDGGKSFNKLEFESKEVTLDNGVSIKPYDSPRVPYEKDGKLYLHIEQGADGDYNGNSSLIYKSEDKGKTWELDKEDNSNN